MNFTVPAAVCLMLFLAFHALSALAQETVFPSETSLAQTVTYTIRVVDQAGNPVSSAVVNVCTDTTCLPGRTDDEGKIVFDDVLQNFHLQLLKVPEGYQLIGSTDLYTADRTDFTLPVQRDGAIPFPVTYTIRVVDESGNPVSGAMVNVCTDSTCMPGRTDENGELIYEDVLQNFHLQLLKLPEGYAPIDRTEDYTEDRTDLVFLVASQAVNP